MKIDLKSKFFYLFLIGVFFLLPRTVYAEIFDTVNSVPKITLYTSDNKSYAYNSTYMQFGDNEFFASLDHPSDSVVRSTFRYSNSPFDGTKNLDISFMIYSEWNKVLPTVNVDGTACEVYFSGSIPTDIPPSNDWHTDRQTYNNIYNVSCKNVSSVGQTFNINIYSPKSTGYYGFAVNRQIYYSNSTEQNIGEINGNINSGFDSMKDQQQQTNDKLDEIQNSDISDRDKEMPDDSSYHDYSSTQDEILDMTSEADLSILDVGLDAKSSSWVWDTLTRLLQSNSVIFGTIIAILSIGVIKLVLGR